MNTNSMETHVDFDGRIVTSTAHKIHSFREIPDLTSLPDQPVEYIVDGLFPKRTVMLLAGTDGCGKSLVAEALAISIASGRSFLGRRCQQTPALILDYENPLFEIRQRLDLLAGDLKTLGQLRIWGTWLEEQPPQIGNELLLTIAKETKPLIVVDTLRAAHGLDENSSGDMQSVMNVLRYCASQGATVLILHHLAKAEGSQFRGSTAIKGAVDLSFTQTMSDETGLITLTCTKNRFGQKTSFTLKPDFDSGSLEVVDSPEFTRYNSELAVLRKIIERNPGASQNRICELVDLRRAAAIRLLKENSGKLWKIEIGPNRATLYYPLSHSSQVVPIFPEPPGTTGTTQTKAVGDSGGSPLKGGGTTESLPVESTAGDSRSIGKETNEHLCSRHGFHNQWDTDDGKRVCARCRANEGFREMP